MSSRMPRFPHRSLSLLLAFIIVFAPLGPAIGAQDILTGAFSGRVTNDQGGTVAGATIRFIDKFTGITRAARSGANGEFYKGSLPSSTYIIEVEAPGYKPYRKEQPLVSIRTSNVVPVPIQLTLANAPSKPEEKPKPADPAAPTTPAPAPAPAPTAAIITPIPGTVITDSVEVTSALDATDGRRGGAFIEGEVSSLPLGGATLTRSFDELALLLPGVAPPPQTGGTIAGPGVGPGVGTSGQFSVNGLRSRANNFTVDGSDNNDEDIGVRRQGFLSLVPQPIESIREYQIITTLPPAQLGRNLGAQVNAISKSGSNVHHGTLYGLFNSSRLNARDFFDLRGGDVTSPLMIGTRSVISCDRRRFASDEAFNLCLFSDGVGGTPITSRLNTGGKDSMTLFQPGVVLGGPVPRFGEGGPVSYSKLFYFMSAEGQILNANKESNFAVPTIQDRGAFESGSRGLSNNPFPVPGLQEADIFAFPTTVNGDAIFSLFPFPNNPGGVYGGRTFTQVLPASAQGRVVSGKIDYDQLFAARYNFTDDERSIPYTGGALFSGMLANVRTQNLSLYMNRDLTGPNSTATTTFTNQFRFSYGRTRLNFTERRDGDFLLPVTDGLPARLNSLANEPFFLNAPYLANFTLPTFFGEPNNTGPVIFSSGLYVPSTGRLFRTTQDFIGPVGQVNIAGYSPVGTDVINFPQRRVNNTYQIADQISGRSLSHSFAFGADIRRADLNSDLPRNSRPQILFTGAPRLIATQFTDGVPTGFRLPRLDDPAAFLSPATLAAASAPSNSFLSIANGADSVINLRNYQLNFFAQDEYRVRQNLTLSYGLRYEINTVPEDREERIEKTFNDPLIASSLPGLRTFINNRTRIYDGDHNNFGPRAGFAYAPNTFGPNRSTVIRGGYGLYYDQVLGAVVSQSRNVFPSFLTSNFGGGPLPFLLGYNVYNHLIANFTDQGGTRTRFFVAPQPGRPNAINPQFTAEELVRVNDDFFPSAFGATLPAKELKTPLAHQYSVTIEQQLAANHFVSAGYVGTLGRNLLRFTTPNLGQNYLIFPFLLAGGPESDPSNPNIGVPVFYGLTTSPGATIVNGQLTGGRPVNGVGAINQFETTARSRYDSLQVQFRGRFAFTQNALQYQFSYTFAKVIDDVSDVFDLAGASALPQRSCAITNTSCNYDNERGPANFDVRHRLAYSFMYAFPTFNSPTGVQQRLRRALLGGLEVAGTGQLQTGQPFTINSTYDVNLDGNATDRINTTSGIVETNDRQRPLRLTANPLSLLANPGSDGSVGRNTFRAGNYMLLNLALIKNFVITDRQRVIFRAEFFNFPNRTNFAIPVRFLEAPGFGTSTDTITPGRRIQFALKYAF